MDIFAGSSTGILKGFDLSSQSYSNLIPVSGLIPKEDEVTVMTWTSPDETEALCGKLNRDLKIYDTLTGDFSTIFNCEGGEGKIKGLQVVEGDKILTGVESGLVKVWETKGKELASFETGKNLSKMRGSPVKSHVIATGGKETPLKFWDLNSPEKPTFMAKNVKRNFLQLDMPVYVRDFRFLEDGEQVVTCTGHNQIRVYDPRGSQRRPVTEIEWLDQPFGALDTTNKPHEIIAGNTQGGMALFDLRNKGKMVHVYKGFAGSIRSIEAHPTEPYVASCGADRFFRLHHVDSKELLQKIYCKVPMNCLLMRKDLAFLRNNTENGDEIRGEDVESNPSDRSDDSDDELWDDMATIDEEKKKKNRKLKNSRKRKRRKNSSGSDSSESNDEEGKNNSREKIRKRKTKHQQASTSDTEIETKAPKIRKLTTNRKRKDLQDDNEENKIKIPKLKNCVSEEVDSENRRTKKEKRKTTKNNDNSSPTKVKLARVIADE